MCVVVVLAALGRIGSRKETGSPSVHASGRSELEVLDEICDRGTVIVVIFNVSTTLGLCMTVMNGAVITGLPLMTVNDGAPLAATGVLEVIELNVRGTRIGAAHPTQPVPGICFMHLLMDLS